jgi:hypothetical protein
MNHVLGNIMELIRGFAYRKFTDGSAYAIGALAGSFNVNHFYSLKCICTGLTTFSYF